MIASFLGVAGLASAATTTINVPVKATPPDSASSVLPRNYMSFSIEMSSFPDYAGNNSHPNLFTKNLISNLVEETQDPLVIRIGGATAERNTFIADQEEAYIPFWDYSYNRDQPKNMTIGPSFWQSLTNLQSKARFIFNLNFAKNDSTYIDNMLGCIEETYEQVDPESIGLWEIGNEDDQSVGHQIRPSDYNISTYAEEWLNRSRAVNAIYDGKLRFMAPSFAGLFNDAWWPTPLFQADELDMDRDGWIDEVAQHFYMAGVQNNPELQKHLMNHTQLLRATNDTILLGQEINALRRLYVMGETNSIYGQGAMQVSDVFGSTLWGINYGLWMASNGVHRLHFHQGTSYRYASWLPVKVNQTEAHVRPPYYGNVFLARFIGSSGDTQVANFPIGDDFHVAYGAYDGGELSRLALLNLREYTVPAEGTGGCRPRTHFKISAPEGKIEAKVSKLRAPEAVSTTDITIDGVMYSYNEGMGAPVRVRNDTRIIQAEDGVFTIPVEASGAVIVTFS